MINFNHHAPVLEFSLGSKQSSWWVPCSGPATLKYLAVSIEHIQKYIYVPLTYHAVSIEHIEVYVIKRVLCPLVQNEASQTRKWLKNVIFRHIYKIRFFVFGALSLVLQSFPTVLIWRKYFVFKTFDVSIIKRKFYTDVECVKKYVKIYFRKVIWWKLLAQRNSSLKAPNFRHFLITFFACNFLLFFSTHSKSA